MLNILDQIFFFFNFAPDRFFLFRLLLLCNCKYVLEEVVPTEEVRKEGERDEPKIKGHQGRDIYTLLSVKYTVSSTS